MHSEIKKLIISSPYEEPTQHSICENNNVWKIAEGRREAGYLASSEISQRTGNSTLKFKELPLVQDIRHRVQEWRNNDYPSMKNVTRCLIEHFKDRNGVIEKQLFFCQIEAFETLVFLTEAPANLKVGIDIEKNVFQRYCSKMATGTGKTVVMAMLIAWQVINKVKDPSDKRFSKYILIITPGHTVLERLSAINPEVNDNYYKEFNLIPREFESQFYQGVVTIKNWQSFNLDKLKPKPNFGVDKRKPMSKSLFITKSLPNRMKNARDILVINDEGHHAWRLEEEVNIRGINAKEKKMATKWIEILDMIHEVRGINVCYDFSATPFIPSGSSNKIELFPWIVSDFGLFDAIESGLVKTPYLVAEDNSKYCDETGESKLYDIYEHVKDELNNTKDTEAQLPELVTNAIQLLGADWVKTKQRWKYSGIKDSPVMIIVVSNIEIANWIYDAFKKGTINIEGLDTINGIRKFDTEAIDNAKSIKISDKLRNEVDTAGRNEKPGESVQVIISVSMLTEGWDAKTVTHILGLRAFTSQLLCEQIMGRGLRRMSYDLNPDGRLETENVNVYGIPFSYIPHQDNESRPIIDVNKVPIFPDVAKSDFEIKVPNVLRFASIIRYELKIDWEALEPMVIDGTNIIDESKSKPLVGKEGLKKIVLDERKRDQEITYDIVAKIFFEIKRDWAGKNKSFLIDQLLELVKQFIRSDKLNVTNIGDDQKKRRLAIRFNMESIIRYLCDCIRMDEVTIRTPVFVEGHEYISTGDMKLWYAKEEDTYDTNCSHINKYTCASNLEADHALMLDQHLDVLKLVKNERQLKFKISYRYEGKTHNYIPDFIAELSNGDMVIIEVKGKNIESNQDRAKYKYAKKWVANINECNEINEKWHFCLSYETNDAKMRINSIIRSGCNFDKDTVDSDK